MPLARIDWPGGAGCAVALTFDNFGESFDLLRYGYAGGALADGVYAPRRGVERILDLLERFRVPATFFIEGWNARKYAALAREIEARGHEVGAHGWMHERWNELPLQDERDLIQRTTETLSEVLGHPPQGWRAPGGLITPHTLGLLAAAGYQYDSSFADDDLPYRLSVAPGATAELIELPWEWQLDDAVYYAHPSTMRRAGEVADLWVEEFDAYRRLTGYFMLVCHPRYSGRPARLLALEHLVAHVAGQSDVWFARCRDVAAAVAASNLTARYSVPE